MVRHSALPLYLYNLIYEYTCIYSYFLRIENLFWSGVVSRSERRFPAHSSCAEHERRWKAEDYVRSDLHQRYWSKIRQHCLQKSRCRHEQEVSDLFYFIFCFSTF